MKTLKILGGIAFFSASAALTFAGPGLNYWKQQTSATRTVSSDKTTPSSCHSSGSDAKTCCQSCASCTK